MKGNNCLGLAWVHWGDMKQLVSCAPASGGQGMSSSHAYSQGHKFYTLVFGCLCPGWCQFQEESVSWGQRANSQLLVLLPVCLRLRPPQLCEPLIGTQEEHMGLDAAVSLRGGLWL